jgi:CheY-like chemotaxis protein
VGRVILVVDDEPLVLEITASMLEDLGCEVITAPSAKDALEKLSTHAHIEILITDVNMPEMDGYQLVVRCQQMIPVEVPDFCDFSPLMTDASV